MCEASDLRHAAKSHVEETFKFMRKLSLALGANVCQQIPPILHGVFALNAVSLFEVCLEVMIIAIDRATEGAAQ